MTPQEKIILLNERGKKWGEIASILGVSRQFLTRVRSGIKNLSAGKMKILDDLVSTYATQDGTQNGNQSVVKESPSCYDQASEIAQLRADIEELKIDMKVLKKLIIK